MRKILFSVFFSIFATAASAQYTYSTEMTPGSTLGPNGKMCGITKVLVRCYSGDTVVGSVRFKILKSGTVCKICRVEVLPNRRLKGINMGLYQEFFSSIPGQRIENVQTRWGETNADAYNMGRRFLSCAEAGSHTPSGKVMAKNGFYIEKIIEGGKEPNVLYKKLNVGDEIPDFYDPDRRSAVEGVLDLYRMGQGYGQAASGTANPFKWNPGDMAQTGLNSCVSPEPGVSRFQKIKSRIIAGAGVLGLVAGVANAPATVDGMVQRHQQLVSQFPSDAGVVAPCGAVFVQFVENGIVDPVCTAFAVPFGWLDGYSGISYGMNPWNPEHRQSVINMPSQAYQGWSRWLGFSGQASLAEECPIMMAPPLDD